MYCIRIFSSRTGLTPNQYDYIRFPASLRLTYGLLIVARFSSLTASYILKVTKFLVKTSQFEHFCFQTFYVIKHFRF